MSVFTDDAGNSHLFRLNCFNVELIRDCVKDSDGNPVDLLSILNEAVDEVDPDTLMNRITNDRQLLCRILFTGIHEAPPAGEKFNEFRKQMTAEVLDAASDVFVREIIQLFPAHKRETLRRLWETQLELEMKTQELIQEEDLLLRNYLMVNLSMDGNSFGGLPEFSESTPGHSQSDN